MPHLSIDMFVKNFFPEKNSLHAETQRGASESSSN